jgi:hypothetical protein
MGPEIRGQAADVDFHAKIIVGFSEESKSVITSGLPIITGQYFESHP